MLAQLDPSLSQENGAQSRRGQGRGGRRRQAANGQAGGRGWQGNSSGPGGMAWTQRPRMSDAERQARQAQRLDQMARQLNLSGPQKQQVQALFENMRQQRQALFQNNTTPTREQRMEERMRGR